MAVRKRGNTFQYRFMIRGTTYSGPCPGCTTKLQAEKYEAAKRQFVQQNLEDIRANKTVTALVENYRKELSGGKDVAIADAFDLAAAKPSRYTAASSYAGTKRTYWEDFAAFMAATYPDVKDLAAVRRTHCEAYVSYLTENGRFVYEKTYQMSSKKRGGTEVHTVRRVRGISPKTIHEIVCVCKGVFTRLEEDAGIVHNPWNSVVLPAKKPVPREIFTPSELQLIDEGIKKDDFCRPLFLIAANSGFTEGDICTLKWSEIDFASEMIRHIRRKTRWKKETEVLLPMIPELVAYLLTLPRTDEYVLPEHARRYLNGKANVSYHVTTFLNGLGIKTRREVPGRKSVSVKDLHSLRHVFAYRARRAGVSEDVLRKLLGHEIVDMTRHYADHDTEDDLKAEMKKLPALLIGEGPGANQGEVAIRRRLVELLPSIPVETVQRWLAELSGALPQ